MTADQSKNITAYEDINNLLAGWVTCAKSLLGGNVVGLYLSGSLTYGDFVPERSDIDLEAVVRIPLNENELKSLEQLHKDLEGRHPAWAKRTECSYVPLEFMREVLPPKTPRPWWGFGTLYPMAPAGNEWIINHYFLSRYGIALEGPNFNTLIPTIKIPDVRKASARDLFTEWAPKLSDRKWLADSHYQSYLVLNLCRILHAFVQGEVGAKKAAAAWVKIAYPQWKNLIEEAENWQYGLEMQRTDEASAFIRFAIEKVTETNILE